MHNLPRVVTQQWTSDLVIASLTHTVATYNTTHTHTHTNTRLTALCPGLHGWAGTRKVKPIWILLKQETVSGSGIRWDICKSTPHSRQITMPAPHRSVLYRPDALPVAQPTVSKHWRQSIFEPTPLNSHNMAKPWQTQRLLYNYWTIYIFFLNLLILLWQ